MRVTIQPLFELLPRVQVAKENVIIGKRIKLGNKLTYFLLGPYTDVVQVYIVDVKHLCRITRLVKRVVIQSFLRFNYAWQVD